MIKGKWTELGPVYDIPVEPRLLTWIPPSIPPGVLAVALREYELENPGTRFRLLLTMNAQQRRRLATTRPFVNRHANHDFPANRARPLAKASGM